MPREDPLLKDVGELLRDFRFDAHWPNKSIPISDLKTEIKKPKEIQIDIIAKIGRIGFLVEVTTEKNNNEKKINKFILKYRAIKKSSLQISKLSRLFTGIPPSRIESFNEVKKWKAIYIGTSSELVYEEMTPKKFSDSEGLTIINIDDWNYIITLKKAIGEYARFEFLSFLGLDPDEIEGIKDKDEYFEYYKVDERRITKGSLNADIYSFSASPYFLLRTCKVFRFHGLPLADSKSYYQRMISKSKLDNISKNFISGSSPKCCFPTPITVVLPSDVRPVKRKDKLKIPISFKYGSLNIIDGQHRLYAYAYSRIKNKIPEEFLEESRILVNGIKFNTDKPKIIGNFSARTFIDINREQTKVKTSLLYSISYDAMNDTSHESLAGKIISLCNSAKKSRLHDLFEGRVVGRKSKLKIPRTSIVEVTKALAKIIKESKNLDSKFSKNISNMLGKKHPSYTTNANDLIKLGEKIVNKYFNRVLTVLPDDWTENTKSTIFRSKYMAAFIRLLLDSIKKGHTFTEIENRIKKISDNMKSTEEWKNSVKNIPLHEQRIVFHENRAGVPFVKFGTGKILNGLLWYENESTIWPELSPK